MVWEGGHFTCWCFQDKFLSRHCADQLLQVQGGRLALLQQEQQPVSHLLWHSKGSQAEDLLGQTPLCQLREQPPVPPSTQWGVWPIPKPAILRAHRLPLAHTTAPHHLLTA